MGIVVHLRPQMTLRHMLKLAFAQLARRPLRVEREEPPTKAEQRPLYLHLRNQPS